MPNKELKKQCGWKEKVHKFVLKYEAAHADHPDWSLEKIAVHLNYTPRTAYRLMSVHKHLDDPRISDAASLRDAHNNIKLFYKTPTDTIAEITNTINSIVPTGEPLCQK